MKKVIAGLFVFVLMFSFVIAESSSSTQTNFYIQTGEMTGGYNEDAVDDADLQNEWLSWVICWSLIIIVIGIIIKFLKGLGGKTKSRVTKKKTKVKRKRRKKK